MPNTRNDDLRLVRMLLPAPLLREVDELVLSGRGGYGSRQEFLFDAVQNHALEVKHGPSKEDQIDIDRDFDAFEAPTLNAVSANGHELADGERADESKLDSPPEGPRETAAAQPGLRGLSETALRAPIRGATVEDGVAHIKREPLLGLHNRDYPSLWASQLLGQLTQHGPVPFPMFTEEATREAWRYADALLELEKTTKTKLTALFPTNPAKPQSAEEGFRAFAIGTIARKPSVDGSFATSGPFFTWRLCELIKSDGTVHIALTNAGWQLLESLDGLTLASPHERHYAERFFDHLRRHAPWDWAGFEHLLEAVSESPSRSELTNHFSSWQADWSETVANTNAAGFVARGREWGLVEPKLDAGRYALTEFGEATLKERSPA